MNSKIKDYKEDMIVARTNALGANDLDLLKLREKLLGQNSFALEQLTRKKILGYSDSSSNNLPSLKNQGSGSDSSSLEKNPLFLFNLLKKGSQNGQAEIQKAIAARPMLQQQLALPFNATDLPDMFQNNRPQAAIQKQS